MSEEMSSKNSNNSDIEVIGLEDLEDSPPPQDTAEADTGSEEAEAKEASPEVSGAGDQETEAIGEVQETEAKEATPEVIGEVKETEEATPAPATDTEDPPVEVLAPAASDPDDPPMELLAPAPDPDLAPAPEAAVRPVVTATRPAATLEEVEDDGEEDDDDIDETLGERLLGLTEMFPDFLTNGTVSIAKGSVSWTKWSYEKSRTVSFIAFSSAALLFMPLMIETERLQIQDQQKAQKTQMLLGAGVATSGAPSIGPPPI